MNPEKQQNIYVTVLLFYSISNMSSCRKPEMQNNWPKTPKSSDFVIC